MGFDDMRPRAKVYDTWGLIGSQHRAPEPKPEPTLGDILGEAFAKAEAAARQTKSDDELQEGDACPECGDGLVWITHNACHPSQREQIGCKGCGALFGESFP